MTGKLPTGQVPRRLSDADIVIISDADASRESTARISLGSLRAAFAGAGTGRARRLYDEEIVTTRLSRRGPSGGWEDSNWLLAEMDNRGEQR